MATTFFDWTQDDSPGEIVDVRETQAWLDLENRYATGGSAPLRRIFEIAQQHGVASVLIERRYIDADWRSEHAEFYGSTFRRYPSVCHRLHFFSAAVPSDFDDLTSLQPHYRGYTVMRPIAHAPVGRTMIAPPPEMNEAIVAQATETVNLFGWDLKITSMPFTSQDAQYLRCAHASIWMVLRHAAMVHGMPRYLPGDIHEACSGGVMVGRQVPSAGLSMNQMLAGSTRLGLSMARHDVPAANANPVPGDLTLYSIVCRYVSSELPPIVISQSHAWVIVGWKRVASPGHSRLTLWRHDDAVGPFIRVLDPYDEAHPAHRDWMYVLMPLMPKMYIAAERAEVCGRAWAGGLIGGLNEADIPLTRDAFDADELTFRTFAVRSSAYKSRLKSRGIDTDLAKFYRLTAMPRYIWVVEIVDRRARSRSEPDVLGEILLDSTVSEHLSPLSAEPVLTAHLEAMAFGNGPDHGTTTSLPVKKTQPYLSDLHARLAVSDLSSPAT